MSIKCGSYNSWRAMKARCFNTNNQDYHHYGGRGISVCVEWLPFEGFYKDMGDRPVGMSLDRIDTDGPYCPSNCRWATVVEQRRNMRSNVLIEISGEINTAVEWCEQYGVRYRTAMKRIYSGWSPQDAVTTPVRKIKRLT